MGPSSSWTRRAVEGFKHEVLRNIGGPEVVYIIVLTGIFLFVSLGSHARIAGSLNDEAAVARFGTGAQGMGVITKYYGTPFEMLGTWWTLGDYVGGPEPGIFVVLWGGFLADATIFSLSAFFIVFAVTKLRNDHERRLYYSAK